MRTKCLGFIFLAFSQWLVAQSVELSLPEVMVNDGESVTLPLTVADFDSIVSLQLSIQWDTDVATFEGYTLGELPLLAIGDFQASQGELRISWFDNTGNGRTLADDDIIAYLNFTAMGSPGDFTVLPFTNEPIEIQIFKATSVPGVFEPVGLLQNEGRISIAAPLGFMINTQDVSCADAEDGIAQVSLAVNPDEYTIAWQGPDGFTASTYDLNGLVGGDYSLIISDLMGQPLFNYSFALVEPNLPLSISNIEIIDASCNESNGSFSVEVTGGTGEYSFVLNNMNTGSGPFLDLAAGEYLLEITDENGCMSTETVEVVAPDAPVIELADTLQLCSQSIVLSPGAIGNYQWSTGATSDTLEVVAAGVYAVTVTNEQDCVSEDSILIQAGASPIGMLETDFLELCPGDSVQVIVIGGDVYRWLENTAVLTDSTISNPFVFPDTTSRFVVEVGNDCGFDTLMFDVEVFEVLATAGPDTCIAPKVELELEASGGIFYEWLDNTETLSATDIPGPITSPEDSTTYTVKITDINGCETIDAVTVLVANNPAESIIAYNMISPNDDGKNDELDFGEIGKFGENSLKVYNRWGDLVYQKRNYQGDEERFNGIYKDELLPAGNYFYVLAFRQGSVKQTLTIIRE